MKQNNKKMIPQKTVFTWFWSIGITIIMVAHDILSAIILLIGVVGIFVIDRFTE